jgi:hypothetical protein
MMNHPDQETIELLALGSPEANEHREELAKHFCECEGCRLQYEEMREFYRALHVIEPLDATTQDEDRPRLLAQPGFMVPGSIKAIKRKGGALAMWRSIREHPRVSVGVLAAVVAMTSFFLLNNRHTPTANRYRQIATSAEVNVYRQRLEVFDQRRQWMMELPVVTDSSIMGDEVRGHYRYSLSDVSGDGIPELVTTLLFVGDKPAHLRTLRVLNDLGEELWSDGPQIVALKYRETSYSEWYGHADFMITRNSAEVTMIVSSWNGTRSPSAEVVFDSKGNRLGEYWHFGQLQPADTCDIDGDGINEIIAIGTNQSSSDEMGFAVAVFLKPEKILGVAHSILTPGFDMAGSDAEVAYVKFPLTDLNRACHWGAGTAKLSRSGDLFHFTVTSGMNGIDKGPFSFEYFLDKQLRPIRVGRDENASTYHATLLAAGLIHSRFDSTYLENLRRSVQFWNGSAWQSEPCTIQH